MTATAAAAAVTDGEILRIVYEHIGVDRDYIGDLAYESHSQF
jgi:hypothetical protein